jgi:hypothetical protein
MIIGTLVMIPWPSSGLLAMIVTMPSGATRTKAFGENAGAPAVGAAPCANSSATGSNRAAISTPPPAAVVT